MPATAGLRPMTPCTNIGNSAETAPPITGAGQYSYINPEGGYSEPLGTALESWSVSAESTIDESQYAMGGDEELNDESLNALKSALEDLKIVDVVHKPQGLSNDLKAGQDFMKNDERLRQLASKGFTPAVTKEGGALELVSSDGEAIATMKNGTKIGPTSAHTALAIKPKATTASDTTLASVTTINSSQ